MKKAGRECVLECGPEKDCHPATCCSIRQKSTENFNVGIESKTMDNDSNNLQAVTVIAASNSVRTNSTVTPEDVAVTTTAQG